MPTGNELSRVYSTAPNNIWLTGQHGTVMQWTGYAWIVHRPPVPAGQEPAQYPMSISGRSGADMWMIYGSTIVHWDGATWTIRDELPPNGVVAFNSIWEAPNGDVWVTMNTGSVKRSRNGGAFLQMSAGCDQCFLGSIWGVASDDFFITTLPAGILHYDGQSFVRSYNGPLIAGSYMGSKNDVWVSGADGAVLHWDGAAWTTVSTGPTNWYVTGMAVLASNDVWWWASVSSAMSAFLHWDGAAITTTFVDTTNIPSLYSGAIIDGRWWLVGGAGVVYTRSAANMISPIKGPPPFRGAKAMWGSADSNMYFATGGEIYHWDGTTTTAIPIAANTISGVRREGFDEIFATGFELSSDHTKYIANAFHFDGTSWTKTQLEGAPLAERRYFSQVFAMGPGEAMAVGYGGIAYHYANGTWTSVATEVTTDLVGVWGPTADQVWMTGPAGTLLTWNSSEPGVATRDTTLPFTTDDLGPIHGADGITWIGVTNNLYVYRNAAPGGWTKVMANVVPNGLFAVSATNVVVSSSAQSRLARWNGAQFVAEDNASGIATPILFRPPGGTMLASGLWGLVQHP